MPLGAAPARELSARDLQSYPARAAQPEEAAASLLVAAREFLGGGRPETAQRAMEQLVARYPDTEAATAARRDLLALYSANPAMAPQSPTLPLREPAPVLGAVASPAWSTSVKVHRRLQDELRNSVGDRMFFAAGSADLGGRARQLIVAQADWLQQRPGVVVAVEGHADDAGAGADDEALSAARAAAVRDLLIAEGVAADRIRAVPQGARDPVAVCDASDCAAQNRRVVLQVALRRTQLPDNQSPSAAADRPSLSQPR